MRSTSGRLLSRLSTSWPPSTRVWWSPAYWAPPCPSTGPALHCPWLLRCLGLRAAATQAAARPLAPCSSNSQLQFPWDAGRVCWAWRHWAKLVAASPAWLRCLGSVPRAATCRLSLEMFLSAGNQTCCSSPAPVGRAGMSRRPLGGVDFLGGFWDGWMWPSSHCWHTAHVGHQGLALFMGPAAQGGTQQCLPPRLTTQVGSAIGICHPGHIYCWNLPPRSDVPVGSATQVGSAPGMAPGRG